MFIPLGPLLKRFLHFTLLHLSLYYLVPYICREEYKQYLGRPDLKQELVTHWQKDFNSIPDDMREDEDTKAELHLRLDVRRTYDHDHQNSVKSCL